MEHSNQHACDDEYNRVIGPILFDESTPEDRTQPVFYLANEQALETDRYEFHKNRKSEVANSSYVYMLYELDDIDVNKLENYLSSDLDDSTLNLLEQESQIEMEEEYAPSANQLGFGSGVSSLFDKATAI